jgi:hypothetical protein
LRLHRTGAVTSALTVNLRRAGLAAYTSDYTTSPAMTGTVTRVSIPAGSNSLDVVISPVSDGTTEGPEWAELTIWQDSAYAIMGPNVGRFTIDDAGYLKPSLSVGVTGTADNLATESGSDLAYFRIYRSSSLASNITVYFTMSGTASNGVDYLTVTSPVTLPAGATEVLVPVVAMDDGRVETDETVTLTLTANAAYNIGTSAATLTIGDDDPPRVFIHVTDNAMAEPNNAATFRVTRVGDLTGSLVVRYALSGTATPGVDHNATTGTVTIAAGAKTATFNVTPTTDSLVEGDETVIVSLVNSNTYNVVNPAFAQVILLDDELSTISISSFDTAAAEAGGGTNTAAFVITRAAPTSGDLTVNYSVAGEALPGVDYGALPGFVVIPAGSAASPTTSRRLTTRSAKTPSRCASRSRPTPTTISSPPAP